VLDVQGLPVTEVVVVNWRRADLTIACVESLRAEAAASGATVTVVDNGSGDGSASRIAAAAPWVRLVEVPDNRGFAAGVGAALAASDAEVLVLLNNDALARPGFVSELVGPFAASPRLGATTARLLLLDADGTSDRTNSTGNVVDRAGNGGDRDWQRPHPVDSPAEVFGFGGGACALRVTAVRDSGGFDESLFMYYEDTDLSWKLRRRGWDVRYVGAAVALHRHASSSGVESELFVTSNTRNRLVVALRHGPWSMVSRAVSRTTVRLLVDGLHGIRSPRERRRAVWRARALGQFLARVPRTLAERRAVDAGASVSRATVVATLPTGASASEG